MGRIQAISNFCKSLTLRRNYSCAWSKYWPAIVRNQVPLQRPDQKIGVLPCLIIGIPREIQLTGLSMITANNALEAIQEFAHPLTGNRRDFDRLFRHAGKCSFVLLGEASHGTHEFYRTRAEITKHLITECNFNLVCWEADWPDALRV